jgi:hypothetical protein
MRRTTPERTSRFSPSGAPATIAADLKAGRIPADQEGGVTTGTNKRGSDAAGMEARMDAIRLKQMLGGALTEQELMCVQIEQNGFGCRGCSSPAYVVDARPGPDETASA